MYLSNCFVRVTMSQVTLTRNISFGTIFKHLFMVVVVKFKYQTYLQSQRSSQVLWQCLLCGMAEPQ